ncbi:MAG: hypothetical protein M4579_003540 [Chaenotheca gracillima]|nr:MAG: hypothetical protein M4579_003540 [Chaenotheca gracillima]
MATGAVSARANNVPPLSEKDLSEIREYEKILRIRDDIFEGKHPRLKLPANVNGKVGFGTTRLPSRPASRPSVQAHDDNPFATKHGSSNAVLPAAQHSPGAFEPGLQRAASSRIDPVLLTKSDDLIKAELQLRRQRIERSLKDQVDRQRTGSKLKPSTEDTVPDFDVSAVLTLAQELVKPLSPEVHQPTTTSDSFDENSFYSSQHDSFPSEDELADQRRVEAERAPALDETQANNNDIRREQDTAKADAEPGERQHVGQIARRRPEKPELTSLTQPRDAEQITDLVSSRRDSGFDSRGEHDRANVPQRPLESYEPRLHDEGRDLPDLRYPGATAQGRTYYADQGQLPAHEVAREEARKVPVAQPSPPSPEVTIRRNHNLSPAAPQPARISPLAVARMPAVAQLERLERPQETSAPQVVSGSQSPPSPAQVSNPRKRRRGLNDDDKSRKVSTRQVARSPEPYIKEEPRSPPVLTMSEFPAPKRHQQARTSLDYEQELNSHPLYRPHPALEREKLPSTHRYERHAVEDPRFAGPSRMVPRTYYTGSYDTSPQVQEIGRPEYVRRLQSPSSYAQIRSPMESQSRRVTYQAPPARQPSLEELRPAREEQHHYAGLQGASNRSQSPPMLREPRYAPTMMAPPARRIVIDENGERYYSVPRSSVVRASVAPSGRESVVGQPRPMNMEHYYERVRVPQERIYDDRRYVEELGPPRRVASPKPMLEPTSPVDYRAYRQREYSSRPGEVMIPAEPYVVQDYPGSRRQASHFEEAGLMSSAREQPVQRVHSVRPPSTRYERPPGIPGLQPSGGYPHPPPRERREYMAASVAPREVAPGPRGMREFSVRADDPRREYVPVERERFTYVPQSPAVAYAGERNYITRPAGAYEEAPGPAPPPPEQGRKTSYRYGAI